MNKLKVTVLGVTSCLLGLCTAHAHVSIIYPRGGEIFMPQSQIEIQWVRSVSHNQMNWDLYYSSDGGATWVEIRLDIPNDTSTDQFTYVWTVPKILAATGNARIRIVQDNVGLNYEGVTPIFTIELAAVAIDLPGEVPTKAELLSVYPNPFSSSAVIEFKTSNADRVTLEVFDLQGKKVAVIMDHYLMSGLHTATWIADGNPAGVYFFRIKTGDYVENRKILLLR